jgi:septal ring factor EnvC (AmiA/AmiB activator)/transglutaminase-like putative cysteine protease
MNEVLPDRVRAAHQAVMWPLAAAVPLPLPWTRAATLPAVALYEAVLLFFFLRARAGRPARVSNGLLNAMAFAYLGWFFLEIHFLHHGLVKTASHLLLFTAAAKFAALRSEREERTLLLLCFFLALDSSSTSTHVVSLLYLGLLAFVAFRALARLAVLADFGTAPPAPGLRAVPSGMVSAISVAAIAVLAVPFFVALPRLQSPFASARVPSEAVETSFSTTDRVDLDGFSASKRSDRILMKVLALRGGIPSPLRLREAAFNRYSHGRWTRQGLPARGLSGDPDGRVVLAPEQTTVSPPRPRARMGISLSSLVSEFLFVPYGTGAVTSEVAPLAMSPDGTLRFVGGRRGGSYEVEYDPSARERTGGRGGVVSWDVPPEVAALSRRIAAGSRSRREIANRIAAYFRTGFVYTLDVPKAQGDPVVDFLTRTHAGHCEYFASAMALMLRAQGIPARLVAGSLGGEIDPLSSNVVIRGQNLHAWVEADVDGTGFSVFDPTPPAGRPRLERLSLSDRLAQIGEEIEFFYDRNILGFDAFDQARMAERLRDAAEAAREAVARVPRRVPAAAAVPAGTLACLALLFGLRRRFRRRRPPPATRVYLALRRLYRKRIGPLPDSAPSSAVVRGFASRDLAWGSAAREVVANYRREAFGGVPTPPGRIRELERLVSRLRRARGGAALLLVLAVASTLRAAPSAPAAPSSTRQEELARLHARVEESRRRLAEVENQAATLQREVRELSLKLELATRQREWIAARRDDLAARSVAIAAELDQVRQARDAAARGLGARIELLSRLGRYGYLRPLLAVRNRGDFFLALKALDGMARADSRALAQFRKSSGRLEEDLGVQRGLTKEATRLLEEDREQERRVALLKKERVRLLARSRSEANRTRQTVAELSDKAQKLENLLDVLSKGESTLVGSPRPWKGVLDWPAQGRINVTFGRHRHPKFDAWTVSNGIEILAADGAPVRAVFAGRVVFARWFNDYGNMVVLDHGDGILTLYARLRSILVRNGALVSTGDEIGLVGIGPGEEEPSLYFEVRDHQKAMDPLLWLR